MIRPTPWRRVLACGALVLTCCDRSQQSAATTPPSALPKPAATPAPPPELPHTVSVVASGQKTPRSLVVNQGSLLWVMDEPEGAGVTTSAVVALKLAGG